MIKSLKLILNPQPKQQGNSGFTLVELLVAMVLTALVITPILGLVVNMLDTDRKEEAKATSEQEIQAAEDYIARDLQQAIYIYDNDALTNNFTLSTTSGIQDQIPPTVTANISPSISSSDICNSTSTCIPVLVFWKREYVPNSVSVETSSGGTSTQTDGGFAYALVAYYYITNPTSTTGIWSPEARIGRFELRGPVLETNSNTQGTSCDTGYNYPPINNNNITGATLKQIMDQWANAFTNNSAETPPTCGTASQSFTQTVNILIDYVSTTGPTISCPNNSQSTSSNPNGTPLEGVGINGTGFYACVDATNVFAQVYIRGNALARLQSTNIAYSNNPSTYFPSENVQTQGHGYLYVQ
jgi:prepilin-type N-terminal cleavage/methylation domain-containing protein